MHWAWTLAVAALVAWVGVLMWREQERVEARRLQRFRHAADQQFRQLVVPSADPRLHFDGMQVTEVMDEESLRYLNNQLIGIELTRYARNEAGEYFMFVHNPEGTPFFKHVEHRIAKVVLGERYVPLPDDRHARSPAPR